MSRGSQHESAYRPRTERPIDPYYFSDEWVDLRNRVVRRDKGVCFYCGERGHQADHVVPRWMGGRDQVTNLVCSCARCNKLLGGQFFSTRSERKRWVRCQITGRPFTPSGKVVRGLKTGMKRDEYQQALKAWPTPSERLAQSDAELRRKYLDPP